MKTSEKDKMVTLQVSLPPDVAAYYENIAQEQSLSASGVLRMALVGYRKTETNRMIPAGALTER